MALLAWVVANVARDVCSDAALSLFPPSVAANYTTAVPDGTMAGARLVSGAWVNPTAQPAVMPVNAAPTDWTWYIDVGPFFDRFGAAKYAILASQDATVQALVKDLQVRKWIDLQRADVAQGIDLMIGKAVPGVTAALKTAILSTPVSADENLALRKQFFS